MSNPWFRMYSEFSHDPKVQMLSEAMQRRYVMLMCLRCSDSLVTLQDEEVAFHLRISNEELAETKALFIARGFIDAKWSLLNWEKRQFASDTSKARVAKHRALQKAKQSGASNGNVTLHGNDSNALDTDTDTDTDKKKEEKARKPAASSFVVPEWINLKHWDAWHSCPKRKKATAEQKQMAVNKLDEWRNAGIDHAAALESAAIGGWQGLFKPDAPAANKPGHTAAKKPGSHAGLTEIKYSEGVNADGSFV